MRVQRNTQSGTSAFWIRKLKSTAFNREVKKIEAKKFECVLVSQEASQYMMGFVPFDFRNREAASTAAATFRNGSVWEVTTPAFDSKAKPEYNGCPIKAVILLKSPTQVKEITSESAEAYKFPACGLEVALDIRGIMQALQRAGSATRPSKT